MTAPLDPWQVEMRRALSGLEAPDILAQFGPSMARAYTQARLGSPPLSDWPTNGACILAAREGYAQYMYTTNMAKRALRVAARRESVPA